MKENVKDSMSVIEDVFYHAMLPILCYAEQLKDCEGTMNVGDILLALHSNAVGEAKGSLRLKDILKAGAPEKTASAHRPAREVPKLKAGEIPDFREVASDSFVADELQRCFEVMLFGGPEWEMLKKMIDITLENTVRNSAKAANA